MQDLDVVLECTDVHRSFGTKRILYQVNAKIVRGQIVSVVGPSGCGKSTLLNMIVGTLGPSSGKVMVQMEGGWLEVTRPGADRGIVYQHYSLFPFLTAQENVALGLKLAQTSIPSRTVGMITGSWRKLRKQHLEEATAMLERVGLPDAMRKYPSELSGGMRQRVAIAQALIMQPQLMLLDEPFGALDEATREDAQNILLDLYAENLEAIDQNQAPAHTVLIVTHELNEALFVGDRVIGLSQYWDWKAEGFDTCPGATIIYDRTAPVFEAGEEKKYQVLRRRRQEIRSAVFECNPPPPRGEHVRFWDELEAGEGQGVLSPERLKWKSG